MSDVKRWMPHCGAMNEIHRTDCGYVFGHVYDAKCAALAQAETELAKWQAKYDAKSTELAAERENWRPLELANADRDALRASLQAANERGERLRAALEPFSKRADYFDKKISACGEASKWDDATWYADDPPSDIYIGQLRAARAALAAERPSTGET